jgi:hypothetical protein
MSTVTYSWGRYSTAFGDAMALISAGADRRKVLTALEQAREAVEALLDDLPLQGGGLATPLARNVAQSLRIQIEGIELEVKATRQ